MSSPVRDHTVRDQLYKVVAFQQEFTELLGPGKGPGVRPCYNKKGHKNGDKSASLTFSPTTGAYQCKSCGEKGDLFTLYRKVKSWDFPKTLDHLLRRYGMWDAVRDLHKQREIRKPDALFKSVTDETVLAQWTYAVTRWVQHPDRVDFMHRRYGLDLATLLRWRLGYGADGRVWTPVPRERFPPLPALPKPIVAVRKHDAFRENCEWQHIETGAFYRKRPTSVTLEDVCRQHYPLFAPAYGDGHGNKVLNVKGHGATYLYPLEVLLDNTTLYLVGGEFKALLLNQLGVPAVCFTGGEQTWTPEFLPYFIGKHVRVLFDPDPGGVSGAKVLAQLLANSGAYVELGEWPEMAVAELPPKGDVTDYLRLCDWQADALDLLTWAKVEAQDIEVDERDIPSVHHLGQQEVPWAEMEKVSFADLITPTNLNKWVIARAVLAGRGDSPFAVPRKSTLTCDEGKARMMPKCSSCRLPRCGFSYKLELTIEAQMDLVGMGRAELESKLLQEAGVPRNCRAPLIEQETSAIETVILTPTIERELDDGGPVDEYGNKTDFQYRQQPAYIIQERASLLRENVAFDLGGRILPDPKNGRFTFAVREARPVDDDVHHFKPDAAKWSALQAALAGDPEDVMLRLVADLRDHHLHVYGQDEMILALLLAFFLPFELNVGQFRLQRVCPAIMILGASNVGKSTVLNALQQWFGAGKLAAGSGKITYAGLIGGNMNVGQRQHFTWGLAPNCNKGLLGIDEYNKMSEEDLGLMTNVVSSGIAERVTVAGNRRTQCKVRFVYLCNPRGGRSLESYANPVDAALGVCGSPQDLGRLEYLHIQHELTDKTIYNRTHYPVGPHVYTKDLARHHLSWAWCLHPRNLIIEEPEFVLERATALADEFGGSPLMFAAQSKFKLARYAAAYALLLCSVEGDNVIVKRAHIDLAYRMFRRGYGPLFSKNEARAVTKGMLLPERLLTVLDEVREPQALAFLAVGRSWSREDLDDAFGTQLAGTFLRVAQLELGLLSRRGRFFEPRYDSFQVMLEAYIAERERAELNGRIAQVEEKRASSSASRVNVPSGPRTAQKRLEEGT